jgi:proteic killer suppression protein
MIGSFADKWLHNFFVEDKHVKRIPAQIRSRLFRKLQLLDDAVSSADLRSPPSNHFEILSGNLQGKCSIRVNDQWRLIFIWDDERGEANNVYLDNHSYK